MAYQVPVLDGYTYPVAPFKNPNPDVRVVAETPTLLGRTLTDWGTDPSRKDILQSWPVLPAAQFAALNAKALAGGVLSYVDDDGSSYSVVADTPKFEAKTPGGDAYLNVSFKLMVVSSP
jgi:hypothetical protein